MGQRTIPTSINEEEKSSQVSRPDFPETA